MESELELLDAVELRFAMADTDGKFSKTLHSFLAPCLRKLDSTFIQIKQRVISICSHINLRLKDNSSIEMPYLALAELYSSNCGHSPKSFALIYLEMASGRITHNQSIQIAALLIKNIHVVNPAFHQTIIAILLPTLANLPGSLSKDAFSLSSYPHEMKFILGKIADFVLFSPPPSGQVRTAANNHLIQAVVEYLPPGLSANTLKFITNSGKAVWTHDHSFASEMKVNLMRMTMMDEIMPRGLENERFLIYTIASADTFHQVKSIAVEGIKRYPRIDLEDQSQVLQFYEIYQGNQSKNTGCNCLIQGAARNELKIKILEMFAKSTCATNQYPNSVQVCFDAIYGRS